MCERLGHLVGACSALIQSTLPPGPCTDNVIKVLGERVHEVEGMSFSEQIDVFRVILNYGCFVME